MFTHVSACLFHPHTVVLDKQPLLIWASLGQSQVCAQTLKQSRVYVGGMGVGGGTLILFSAQYTYLLCLLFALSRFGIGVRSP